MALLHQPAVLLVRHEPLNPPNDPPANVLNTSPVIFDPTPTTAMNIFLEAAHPLWKAFKHLKQMSVDAGAMVWVAVSAVETTVRMTLQT